MGKMKILIFMAFYLILTSCEKDIRNGLLPGYDKKLVVTSFLSPSDNVSFIRVTSNRPVYGELLPYPDPGEISGWISDGESEIKLTANDSGLVFTKNEMPLINGKTYNIRIVNDEGLEARARCTIPDKFGHNIIVDTFSYQQVLYPGELPAHICKVSVRFRDQPGKDNYYRIIGKCQAFYKYMESNYVTNNYVMFEEDFFTDKKSNNKGEISFTGYGWPDFSMRTDSSFIRIYLLDTEESYYLWHKTILNYKDDENPFTEPTPVYTNIEGGLGVFTSYSMDSVTFRLR